MTTDEIKQMIIDTLQGQGNQIDIGGGVFLKYSMR